MIVLISIIRTNDEMFRYTNGLALWRTRTDTDTGMGSRIWIGADLGGLIKNDIYYFTHSITERKGKKYTSFMKKWFVKSKREISVSKTTQDLVDHLERC